MTALINPSIDKYAPEGALVYCGYWREQYRVVSHNDDGTVTVRWETGACKGETRTHRTQFDRKRDRVLGHPNVVKCTDCDDTQGCDTHMSAKVFCGRCAGTGMFITRIENGKPTGPGGKCFRCMGKGFHTAHDRKRNVNYERFGRR